MDFQLKIIRCPHCGMEYKVVKSVKYKSYYCVKCLRFFDVKPEDENRDEDHGVEKTH